MGSQMAAEPWALVTLTEGGPEGCCWATWDRARVPAVGGTVMATPEEASGHGGILGAPAGSLRGGRETPV